MDSIKEIYGAYIRFPQVAGDIEFNYSNMEISKRYQDMLEMKHYYFTSRNTSTRYFEKRMLEKEYEISNELTVFYSESKEKCIEWLTNKRNTLLESYKYNYERLEKSEIKEKSESEESL